MGKLITDYFLYRWRYVLGYSFVGLTVVGLLVIVGLYIPGGLSQAEMKSVVMSNSLSFSLNSFDPNSVINLPYHLFQRAVIHLFGLSPLSIKLPSLILGLFSTFGMLILLRMWFRQNVAVLTSILVITTGQFLFIAQSGTPSIVYIFGSIWLLVAALKVSRRAKWSGLWKLFLFALAALSLYTPLSIYILIALASAIALHPHLRYIVRRLNKVKLFVSLLFALIIITPLGYVIFRHPNIGMSLLGIPDSWPNIPENLLQLFKQYFDFTSTSSTTFMTPIYGMGSMILIALGILRLVTTKYTARSYIICGWVILLAPVLAINPSYVSVTFVPSVLLMAMGISTLITNWYTLFPRNPYARLAGLIPLVVLIGGMVLSGIDRYVYGYLYSPPTADNFSNDLRLVNKELSNKSRGSTVLLATDDQLPFYAVVAKYTKDFSVTTSTATIPGGVNTLMVTHDLHQANNLGEPYRIITDSVSHDSDRFYIYKTDTK